MKRFLVLYLVPPAVIDDWSKTDADTRAAAEQKMRGEWTAWVTRHAGMIKGTEAGGKTKRASPGGIADVRNDIMLYSFVEAESHEEAAAAFKDHPHLQIPQSSIDIMEVRPLPAM